MFLGQVQSLVAKRVGIRVRRSRASNILQSGEHRAIRCQKLLACTPGTLTCRLLGGVFFASVSFSPSEKEMKCRHAQWLIVIKNTANSRRPLTPKAATRHQPPPPSLKPPAPKPRPPARAKKEIRLRQHLDLSPADRVSASSSCDSRRECFSASNIPQMAIASPVPNPQTNNT